jgi:hypothetical protein
MSKEHLYTARWYLSTNRPVPAGGPIEAIYELMTPVIGPMSGVNPPVTTPIEPEDERIAESGKRVKVAVVVGHNSRAPGAWVLAPLNLSEFALHNAVFDVMAQLASGTNIELRKFNREASSSGYAAEIDRCYVAVNAWKPDFCVELHFNGGGGNFSMMIVAKGSALGIAAGSAMLETMSDELGIPLWTGGTPRGISQLNRGDRGGRSVWAAACPVVLTEPFFGDHTEHAKRVGEVGINGLASIYMKAIREALKAIGKL